MFVLGVANEMGGVGRWRLSGGGWRWLADDLTRRRSNR